MGVAGTVYFHSGCFDGAVSSVIAADFLVEQAGWSALDFQAVDYSLGQGWPGKQLPEHSAVVDFLFHPGAEFWADHHPTTFIHTGPPGESPVGKWRFFDGIAPSCARLLLDALPDTFRRTSRHEELASWADKTDAARYTSVDEALFSPEPAMIIHTVLGTKAGHEIAPALIRSLREEPLAQVASRSEIQSLASEARDHLRVALAQVRSALKRLPGDVALVDVSDLPDAPGVRYAPYAVWPSARYSVAVVRSPRGVKITAMRNPWREFKSVHLGKVMARFGGGGHERVGALALSPEHAGRVESVVQTVLAEMGRPAERVASPAA